MVEREMVHPEDDAAGEAEVDELEEQDDLGPRPPSAPPALVYAAAALVVLLVGAAIGMLITRATVDEPSVPGPGSVDVGFAQDMAVHHTQAVTMATIELGNSTNKAVRNLAFDIQTSQTNQVGQMNGFLSVWNQPLLGNSQYMQWMAGSGGHDHGGAAAGTSEGGVAQMPGMATTAELKKLRSLSGKDLDVFFLQLMIRHHEGGFPMAKYAYDHAETDAVRTLAMSIIKSQGAEVTTMTDMLGELGAKPLPAP